METTVAGATIAEAAPLVAAVAAPDAAITVAAVAAMVPAEAAATVALPPAVGGTTSDLAEPFFAFDPALKELEQNQRPDATAATVIAASATATAATRDAASLIVAPATVVSISTAAAATLGGLPLRAAVLARYPLPCRDMSLGSGGILSSNHYHERAAISTAVYRHCHHH